jgi:hypothetical protein
MTTRQEKLCLLPASKIILNNDSLFFIHLLEKKDAHAQNKEFPVKNFRGKLQLT